MARAACLCLVVLKALDTPCALQPFHTASDFFQPAASLTAPGAVKKATALTLVNQKRPKAVVVN